MRSGGGDVEELMLAVRLGLGLRGELQGGLPSACSHSQADMRCILVTCCQLVTVHSGCL